jgi:HlyD family secretion protein
MRNWIIIGVVVIILAGIGFYFVQSQGGLSTVFNRGGEPTPTPLPAIQASPEVIVDGVVVPVRSAGLSFQTPGVVAEVLTREGEQVEAGQLVARLDNERNVVTIAQAEARVRSAQARLDELRAGARPEEIAAAQAAVDTARANLDNLREGARPEDVAAAEASLASAQANLDKVLEGADSVQLITAQADIKNAEAALRQAQTAYDDVKWRADVGALPQAAQLEQATINYETAQARYNDILAGADTSEIAAAQAQVEQARAALDKAKAPATAAQIAGAEAEVRRAEAQLALTQAGARAESIQASEAELTDAQTNLMQRQLDLQDTELRAPFAGAIASLDLEVGEQVAAGVPVVQLADQSEWHIDTDDLTEINVVDVNEGDRAFVTFDAIPDLELEGKVVRIKPLGENKQGDITYTATIIPDTYDDRLRWNMTASVRIQTGE